MIARDLYTIRRQAGLTQRPVAKKLGWDLQTYGAIERGDVGVDSETYDRIREAIESAGSERETVAA